MQIRFAFQDECNSLKSLEVRFYSFELVISSIAVSRALAESRLVNSSRFSYSVYNRRDLSVSILQGGSIPCAGVGGYWTHATPLSRDHLVLACHLDRRMLRSAADHH